MHADMKWPVLLTILALLPPVAAAQEQPAKAVPAAPVEKEMDAEIALARADYKADRMDYVFNAMDLSADDRKAFTPIYTEYSEKLSKYGDEEQALILRFAAKFDDMDGKTAAELTRRVLELQAGKNRLLTTYETKLARVLPPAKAARFVQIQLLLDHATGLQILSQLPLIR